MRKGNKPPMFVPHEARKLLGNLSKQAIFDIAANLALIGTDESEFEVTALLCREAVIVLEARGDAVSSEIREAAKRYLDSDPS